MATVATPPATPKKPTNGHQGARARERNSIAVAPPCYCDRVVSTASGVRIGLGCVAAAWGSVVVGSACGDANGLGEFTSFAPLERSLCEKMLECGCGEAFAAFDLIPPLTCDGWTLADAFGYGQEGDEYYYGYGYEGGYDQEEPLPVSVDEECVQRIAARIDALDCSLQFTAGGTDCRAFCWPIVGPRFAGEACSNQQDCGRGLVCDRDECRDPCLVRPPAEGDPCDGGNDCGDALVCVEAPDGDGTGVCMVLPAAGQPCYFGQCAEGLRCDDAGPEDGVCERLTAVGQPCMGHLECESRYCPAGYCEMAPGELQPCGTSDACAPGTTCVEDEVGNETCQPAGDACRDLLQSVFELGEVVVTAGG